MPDVIVARDLMLREFTQFPVDGTLGEAMAALREAQAVESRPNALMVVDAGGDFVGMLTAKMLIRILVDTDPESRGGAPKVDDAQLLQAVTQRLDRQVGSVLPETPAVRSDARLMTMIRRGLPTRLDFVPVVDDRKPVGLVPITAIFQATASLALTPEHEGIRFDR